MCSAEQENSDQLFPVIVKDISAWLVPSRAGNKRTLMECNWDSREMDLPLKMGTLTLKSEKCKSARDIESTDLVRSGSARSKCRMKV